MKPLVFIFFFCASNIWCDDPDSTVYDELRSQGVPRHLIDRFKEHLHVFKTRRDGSETRGYESERPLNVVKDFEDNTIDKSSKEDYSADLTRRNGNTRKFFNWFRNTFKAKQNENKGDTAAAFIDYLKENRNLQTTISNILTNLTETFAKLNNYLEEQQKANEYVLVKVPSTRYVNVTRVKREAAENITRIRTLSKKTLKTVPRAVPVAHNVNSVNTTGKVEPANVTRNTDTTNVTKSVEILNVTRNDGPNNVTISDDEDNVTKTIEPVTRATDTESVEPANISENPPVVEKFCEPCHFNETRRAFDAAAVNNDSLEVKQKLLTYIQEYFQEVKDQIGKLQQMKQVYSKNSSFRIGYIVANVDILQDNINKLKQETAVNHSAWTERQLIEVFDKLKASNKVMAGLIQTVRSIYHSDSNNLNNRNMPTYSNPLNTNLVRRDDTY